MAAILEIFDRRLGWEELYQASTRLYTRHLQNQQFRSDYGRLVWLAGCLPPVANVWSSQWLGNPDLFLPSLLFGAVLVAVGYAVLYHFFPDTVQDPDRLLASQYLVGLLRHDGGRKDRVSCRLDQRNYQVCPHPERPEKAAEGKFGPWKYYRQTWLRLQGTIGCGHELDLKLRRWRRERIYLKRSGPRYKIEGRDEILIRLRRSQPFATHQVVSQGRPPEGWELADCTLEAGELRLWLRSSLVLEVPSFHKSVRQVFVCLIWLFRCLYGPQNLQGTDTALQPT